MKMLLFLPLFLLAQEFTPYDYDFMPSGKNYRLVQKNIYATYRNVLVFKMLLKTHYNGEEIEIPFYYYKSRYKRPRPAVIISPSISDVGYLEKSVAYYLADRGVSALIYRPPFVIQDKNRPPEKFRALFYTSLLSLKVITSWAEENPRIDPKRLGSFGISMGGHMSILLMGLDSRIKASYIAATGSNISSTFSKSTASFFKNYRGRWMKKYQLQSVDDYQVHLDSIINIDPASPKRQLCSDHIYMVIGQHDNIVPTENQEDLWEQLGRPQRDDYPFGHFGPILSVLFTKSTIHSFFKRAWRNPCSED